MLMFEITAALYFSHGSFADGSHQENDEASCALRTVDDYTFDVAGRGRSHGVCETSLLECRTGPPHHLTPPAEPKCDGACARSVEAVSFEIECDDVTNKSPHRPAMLTAYHIS